jgi:hypothetical protein
MQATKAAQLRKDWGNKPCDHPSFDNLYYLGAQDTDLVCEQCGDEMPKATAEKILAQRAKQQPQGTAKNPPKKP